MKRKRSLGIIKKKKGVGGPSEEVDSGLSSISVLGMLLRDSEDTSRSLREDDLDHPRSRRSRLTDK